MNELSIREKVEVIEEELKNLPQLDDHVVHYFANKGTKRGTYAREITIPKGSIIIGKIHKYEQINILSKGDLSVLTEDGVKRVQAPFTVVSPSGIKRIAYAHEESVWTTIHSTERDDVEEIEKEFIAQSNQEYLEFCRIIEDKSWPGLR